MQAAIYKLIANSSTEFADFLHNTGYLLEERQFKLFTFSKLFFQDGYQYLSGFNKVTNLSFLFATPIKESYEHLVFGLFDKQKFSLGFGGGHRVNLEVVSVESVPEPEFTNEMKFIAFSPIVSSTKIEVNGRIVQHYLDYMVTAERGKYIENIYRNLTRKYELIHKTEYENDRPFALSFDMDYILKRKGVIRKKIRFKRETASEKHIYIIGMEAPLLLKGDPELIKIGYECGLGENNSAGFGMIELVDKKV
jgi:CRISPR-associated endoribonuclease Cas6